MTSSLIERVRILSRKIKLKTLELFRDTAKILAPPPQLTISEWADEYRVLSQESSAESGKWRTSRAPYQKEILDSVSDREIETVVIMSSAQVGKTEIVQNVVGYYIDYDPAPIMLLMPTVELAKAYSKKRLATMIRDTPSLREKVKDAKSKDSDNTILEKGFPGGYIAMVGANSPVGLSSRPIRILLADEVDRFPLSAGSEGDPLALAEKRTSTFPNKKKVYVSTPTEDGISRIQMEFEESTKEEWCIPCPVCGKLQPFSFGQIKFERVQLDSAEVKDVFMECKFCKQKFTEFEWKAGQEKGEWISQREDLPEKITKRGFHLNAFASPWERWEGIIEKFLEAKKKGKDSLKVWTNTFLGEVWMEDDSESLDHHILMKRREAYNCEIPDEVLLLTAGVDVQDDRFEIEVVGWGEGKESWGIQYHKIYGSLEEESTWDALDEYLSRTFAYEDGTRIGISCTCIDTGGHYTQETYKFIKPREIRKIFGIKGHSRDNTPFIGKPSKVGREQIHLFPVAVSDGKVKIFSNLNLDFPGPGHCHFPNEKHAGYDREYFKSLCSEKRVKRFNKGIARFEWVKKTKRNEGLDLRNYAQAALEILNPNFERIKALRETHGKTAFQVQGQAAPQRKRRRQISKGIGGV